MSVSNPGRGTTMPHATTPAALEHFTGSVQKFTAVLSWLESTEADQISHGELETQITDRCRDVMNQMMQDRVDLGALRETRCVEEVIDTDGVEHRNVEPGHARTLTTVFGKVAVTRIAYRALGASNLHPADAVLNLPPEKHSHGLRRLTAIESARGSFDDAVHRSTGVLVGKRQLQDLAVRAASDFDTFYQQRQAPPADNTHILALSFDATGIVLRPGPVSQRAPPPTSAAPPPAANTRGPAPRCPPPAPPARPKPAPRRPPPPTPRAPPTPATPPTPPQPPPTTPPAPHRNPADTAA